MIVPVKDLLLHQQKLVADEMEECLEPGIPVLFGIEDLLKYVSYDR
jgi:hypothetical protein